MFDPRHAPAWTRVKHVRLLSEPPLRPGAQIAWVDRVLGFPRHDVRHVSQHVPDQLLELVAQRPFPMQIRYELEGIPEGVIARVRAQAKPAGLACLMQPLLRLRMRRAFARDLDMLKALMESNAFRMLPTPP